MECDTINHAGILGTWQIKEIRSKNNPESDNDQEPFLSLVIFTPCHYSMVWEWKDVQRTFSERWNPTENEKLDRYDSFVVNTGTYKITDSTFTGYPIVARVPEFMGGKFVCEYQVTGDTMVLNMIDEYSYDGVQAPWITNGGGLILTLIRMEE